MVWGMPLWREWDEEWVGIEEDECREDGKLWLEGDIESGIDNVG